MCLFLHNIDFGKYGILFLSESFYLIFLECIWARASKIVNSLSHLSLLPTSIYYHLSITNPICLFILSFIIYLLSIFLLSIHLSIYLYIYLFTYHLGHVFIQVILISVQHLNSLWTSCSLYFHIHYQWENWFYSLLLYDLLTIQHPHTNLLTTLLFPWSPFLYLSPILAGGFFWLTSQFPK